MCFRGGERQRDRAEGEGKCERGVEHRAGVGQREEREGRGEGRVGERVE